MLLTDVDIEELILIPKMIVERMPANRLQGRKPA